MRWTNASIIGRFMGMEVEPVNFTRGIINPADILTRGFLKAEEMGLDWTISSYPERNV